MLEMQWGGGGWRLNMKILSYQERDPHVKDKTVFNMGISYMEMRDLY